MTLGQNDIVQYPIDNGLYQIERERKKREEKERQQSKL